MEDARMTILQIQRENNDLKLYLQRLGEQHLELT